MPSGEIAGVAREGLDDCAALTREKTRVNKRDGSDVRRKTDLVKGNLDCVLMTRRFYHAFGRGGADSNG